MSSLHNRLRSITTSWLNQQKLKSVNINPSDNGFTWIRYRNFAFIRYVDIAMDKIRFFIVRYLQQLLFVRKKINLKSMDDERIKKFMGKYFNNKFILNNGELYIHSCLLLTGITQYCQYINLVNPNNNSNDEKYNKPIIQKEFLHSFDKFVSESKLNYSDKYNTTSNGNILAIYNVSRCSNKQMATKFDKYGEISKIQNKYQIESKQNLFDYLCTVFIYFANPATVKQLLFLDIIIGAKCDKAYKMEWIGDGDVAKYNSKESMLAYAIVSAQTDKGLSLMINKYKIKDKKTKNKFFKALSILIRDPSPQTQLLSTLLIYKNVKKFNGYNDISNTTINDIKNGLIGLLCSTTDDRYKNGLMLAVGIIAMHEQKWIQLRKSLPTLSNIKQHQIYNALAMFHAFHILNKTLLSDIFEVICAGLVDDNTAMLAIKSLVKLLCENNINGLQKYHQILLNAIETKLNAVNKFCPDPNSLNREINKVFSELVSLLQYKNQYFINYVCRISKKLIHLLGCDILDVQTRFKTAELLYQFHRQFPSEINSNMQRELIKVLINLMCRSNGNFDEMGLGFIVNLVSSYGYDPIIEMFVSITLEMNADWQKKMILLTVMNGTLHLSSQSTLFKDKYQNNIMSLALELLSIQIVENDDTHVIAQKYTMNIRAAQFLKNYKDLYKDFQFKFITNEVYKILCKPFNYDIRFITSICELVEQFANSSCDLITKEFENIICKLCDIANQISDDNKYLLKVINVIFLKYVQENITHNKCMIDTIMKNAMGRLQSFQSEFVDGDGSNMKLFLKLFQIVYHRYPLIFKPYADNIASILITPINKMLSHLKQSPNDHDKLYHVSALYMHIAFKQLILFAPTFDAIIPYVVKTCQSILSHKSLINRHGDTIKNLLRNVSNKLSLDKYNKQNNQLIKIIDSLFVFTYNQHYMPTNANSSVTNDDDIKINPSPPLMYFDKQLDTVTEGEEDDDNDIEMT